MSFTIDCRGRTTREINRHLREAIAAGQRDIRVLESDARHNLGVALLQPVHVVFEGSVGYYCAGMSDGAHIEIRGSAGWGTAESMMNGTVVIDGNAGSGVAASIRGGTVVVRGDAAARAGVSMKGGTLLIGGCFCLHRARSLAAATCFGLAAAMKCTALLWAPYLVWRGRPRAAAWLACVALGVNLLPDLVSRPASGRLWLAEYGQRYLRPLTEPGHYLGTWGSDPNVQPTFAAETTCPPANTRATWTTAARHSRSSRRARRPRRMSSSTRSLTTTISRGPLTPTAAARRCS